MSRAFVTGATGFVGGALVRELLASGLEVTALVRDPARASWLKDAGAALVPGDLSDAGAIESGMRGAQVVHHVAAVVRARDKQEFIRSNVDGTRRVFEAAAAQARPPRVVLVSSLAAGGPSPDGHPITEDEPAHPVIHYGRSKLAQEAVAREFAGRVPCVVVRPPVVYGPGDRAVLVLFKLAMLGFSAGVAGGTQRNCMVHVEDLARGLRLAGEAPCEGSTFYLTDGQVHETSQVTREIARVLGRRTLPVKIPLGLAKLLARAQEALTPPGRTPVLDLDKIEDLSQRFWVCSDARARRELGYQSRFDLATGLEQTAAWYRQERWL